ncbi:ROK family transcriptional regulator [Cryobacterium fucosi]|uniref:ROK family transcriptional regulator n=1 Tax=Cryobacterium fucosi TaxID=1259157 RepID=A0A4R9BEI2_9MICO|nr:ROK family transcriptional regulator [Cryobacterium fucosi]TFD82500.1 ROK family transcriptional regulator [Cryobacterium fucosi]
MSNHRKSTATTSTIARVNQTAILEELRNSGALSRQQLGARTGLSPATINRLTAGLIDEGTVLVSGHEPSTGGRPSILLRYAGGSRLVAALQLHANRASGILVDFDGKIVFRREVDFDPRLGELDEVDAEARGQAQQARLDKTIELFDFLIATAAETMGAPCLAVGVAVPGVVRQPEGSFARMPELGWTEVPLGSLLRKRSTLPIVVENDANALAYGELHRGAGRGLTSLVALFLENGLGAGIITNGELHRGARFEAGEIGYLLVERSSLARSYSAYGDLEDRIGSVALTRSARERGIPVPDTGALTAEDIFELAGQGHQAASEIAEEILDMVAIAIAALVIILDPDLVVIGNSFAGNSNTVIPALEERLAGRIIRVPRVEAATHREDAVLLGAAELAAAEVNGFAYFAD